MEPICQNCKKPVPESLGKKPRKYCSRRCTRLAYYNRNREKSNLRSKAWRQANPEKYKACKDRWNAEHPEAIRKGFRRWRLLADHGIDLHEYNRMFEACGGVCEICNIAPAKGKNLNVDHCHTTGKIRGLLCNACNIALGAAKDSPAILRRAADYLERNGH